MRKFFKHVTTMALAAAMLLGTMTTAFAAENNGINVDNTKTGSITIHKYNMPDAENAGESNTEIGGIEVGQDKLPASAEPLENVGFKITKMEQQADGTWNETNESYEVTTDENGEAFVKGIPLGRYKVEETGLDGGDGSDAVLPNDNDEAVTAKAFYVDVPMTQEDGQTLNYDVHVYPKNEVLSIDKDVTYVSNKDDTFNMNEEQTWIINTTIPGNIALDKGGALVPAKIYEVVDNLDTQLTYVPGKLVITAVDKDYNVLETLVKDTDYTTVEPDGTQGGGELKVTLTDMGKLKLKDLINTPNNQAMFLQIRFNTVINETATTGKPIYNDADLNFQNVAGDRNETVSVPEDERPEVHTGRVMIEKIAGDTKEKLPNVEFMIFDTPEKATAAVKLLQDNKATEIKDALEVFDPNQGKFTTTVKTNANGIAEFRGLAYYTDKANEQNNIHGENAENGEKTYYIVETKTVKGYQLPSKYFEVKINHTTSTVEAPSETIVNVRPSLLPKTGGTGTILFTAAGLAVMAAAGVILLASRKKKDN